MNLTSKDESVAADAIYCPRAARVGGSPKRIDEDRDEMEALVYAAPSSSPRWWPSASPSTCSSTRCASVSKRRMNMPSTCITRRESSHDE